MTTDTQPPPAAVLRTVGGLRLLTWPTLEASGFDAAVTARSGGVSSGPYATLNLSLSVGDKPACVLENRRMLAAAFGADLDDFVFARQAHGAGVRVVGEADRGSGAFSPDDAVADTDALVTRSPGVVLAILTADCVPIVLHDPEAGVLACVHAGWRGTVAGVTGATVAVMRGLGSRPSNVIAGIGPAIAADRYQVGPEVHQAVTQAFGPAADAFIRPDTRPAGRPDVPLDARPEPAPDPARDRWLLDLWAANRHALRAAGVPDPQIHITGLSTGPPGVGPRSTGPPGLGPRSTGPQGLRPRLTDHTDTASPVGFFSDRFARPCGRLALVARLRAPGQTGMGVTT
jgi:polyphenol oxidase